MPYGPSTDQPASLRGGGLPVLSVRGRLGASAPREPGWIGRLPRARPLAADRSQQFRLWQGRHAAKVAHTSSAWPRWLIILNSEVSVLKVATTRPEVTSIPKEGSNSSARPRKTIVSMGPSRVIRAGPEML